MQNRLGCSGTLPLKSQKCFFLTFTKCAVGLGFLWHLPQFPIISPRGSGFPQQIQKRADRSRAATQIFGPEVTWITFAHSPLATTNHMALQGCGGNESTREEVLTISVCLPKAQFLVEFSHGSTDFQLSVLPLLQLPSLPSHFCAFSSLSRSIFYSIFLLSPKF